MFRNCPTPAQPLAADNAIRRAASADARTAPTPVARLACSGGRAQ